MTSDGSNYTFPAILNDLVWADFQPERNCSASGELAAFQYSGIGEFPQNILYDFFVACAPVPVDNVNSTEMSDWNNYVIAEKNSAWFNVTGRTIEECRMDFCQNLELEGNPDVAGVGIMASYLLQAIATTLFIVGNLISRYRSGNGQLLTMTTASTKSWRREAVDKLLQHFLEASAWFGMAVTLAGWIIGISEKSAYTSIFSCLGATVTAAVLPALWPWYKATGNADREIMPYLVAWMFGLLFGTMVWGAVHTMTVNDGTFELYCLLPPVRREAFTVSVIISGLMLGVYVFDLARQYVVPKFSKKGGESRDGSHTLWRYYGFSLTAWVLMWVSLFFFIKIRAQVREYIGEGYAENVWGYGQLLAMLAWLPSAVEALTLGRKLYKARGDSSRNPVATSQGVELLPSSEEMDSDTRPLVGSNRTGGNQ